MSKLNKSELKKVQKKLDSIQELYSNGLITPLEKVQGMLGILSDYEESEVKAATIATTNSIHKLTAMEAALELVEYIHNNVNVYL